jgi:hypothetical protein
MIMPRQQPSESRQEDSGTVDAALSGSRHYLCERALKKAILHRKNSLFYKTMNGAAVGDLFMSLIHTCELNGANPFDYLTELQRHAEDLKRQPSEWMPWNYRDTLARLALPAAA